MLHRVTRAAGIPPHLDLARINAKAGEDIRYLPRERAEDLDLPGHDFWLIDSSKAAVLRFGEDDVLLGAEIQDLHRDALAASWSA